MLDIKWIIKNPEDADKSFKRRGLKPLANKLIKMSQSRSQVFVKLENLLKERNDLSNEISKNINKSKKNTLIKKVKSLKEQITKLQEGKYLTNTDLDNLLMELPNFLDKDVPNGKSDNDNVVISEHGDIKKFDYSMITM